MATRAFCLNLDAEFELERPDGYQARRDVAAKARHYARLAQGLVGPDTVLVDEESAPGCAAGALGGAWCPTPRALEVLRRVGALVPHVPALEVLRRVTDRGFTARFHAGLPGAAFCTTRAEVEAVLAGGQAENWVAKRSFSVAARGRRRLRPPLADADVRWIEAALEVGGLQVEPWVRVTAEFSLHGRVDGDGRVELGHPCLQVVDGDRGWLRAERTSALQAREHADLEERARRAARELHEAGYFGPFGVDAFRYEAPDGTARFQALSELNPRYTMAWSVGMGAPAGG